MLIRNRLTGGLMAASGKAPLWKRLVIILSAVVAGVVVDTAVRQAGVSAWLSIVAGAAAVLIVLLVVARLLNVGLKRGWE
jgi:hypothetical protein